MTSSESIPSRDPNVGQILDSDFLLEERIGTGGIGTVYRALERSTNKRFAIKLIHEHLTTRHVFQRFQREATIACTLKHPHIVETYRFTQCPRGRLYLLMEYLDGVNLRLLIGPGKRLSLERAVPIMVQLTSAVAYAHGRKVVHRDLKPENMVLLRKDDEESIKLLDFGLSKVIGGSLSFTKTGVVLGSPYYISPEQWRDPRTVDGRSDLYSLGCIFYLMVTGTLPFKARDLPGIREAHLTSTPSPPDLFASDLREAPLLQNAILRCLRRSPTERFPNAEELLRVLRVVEDRLAPKPSRPPS